MGKTVTATKAVREFSDILNAIKYKGNHYTIIRGGKPVASISPVEPHFEEKSLGELKQLVDKLPRLGDDAERFEQDMKKVLKHQPLIPEKVELE